jgi:ankyrin repeat protein
MSSDRPNPLKLWLAARDGNILICTDLLERYHKFPGYIDRVCLGSTALVAALKHSRVRGNTSDYNPKQNGMHLDVVRVLLAYGAKIETDADPAAALYYAIEEGPSIEYVQLLLNSTQDISVNRDFYGCTPLMTALRNMLGPKELAKEQMLALLFRGADVHALDKDGDSILHQICSADEWVCNTLQKFHADFNRKCRYGRTPLHLLIYEEADNIRYRNRSTDGFVEDVEMFLRYGASVYLIDDTGRTVIQVAAALLPPDNLAQKLLHTIGIMTTFARGSVLPPEMVDIVLRMFQGQL